MSFIIQLIVKCIYIKNSYKNQNNTLKLKFYIKFNNNKKSIRFIKKP